MSQDTDIERDVFKLDPLEAAIDAYVDGYVMEGDEGYHQPTDSESLMIKDAIMGLLVDEDWDRLWGEHVDALAAIKANRERRGEPVAWTSNEELRRVAAGYGGAMAQTWFPDSSGEVALYTSPQPEPAKAQAVPEGWKLVPVEPTRSMMAAAVIYANGNAVYKNVAAKVLEIEESIYGEAYQAMLAASPQPPTPEGE
jgi:hypothetical protein